MKKYKDLTLKQKQKIIINNKYPKAAQYNADWQINNEMGSPCLWLTESLTNKMKLKPGMRVLDMGCGTAMSSIFLAKEYGVFVYAVDLWISASDNWQRICEAGVENLITPISAEAHSLPFADGFFDAIICVNSYQFYGTADNYFNEYFGRLVKKEGQIGLALPGIYQEFNDVVPDYLAEYWWSDFYYFHSFNWWKRHFKRSGTVDIELIDDFSSDGNNMMVLWESIPNRMSLVREDNGRNLSWIRLILNKR